MKKEQVKTVVATATPTMPDDLEKFKEMQTKTVEEIAKMQTKLLETYLFEYCEVNKIAEDELRGMLQIGNFPVDNMVAVVNVDDPRDIKIGLIYHSDFKSGTTEIHQYFEVCGEYISEKDKYPKTTKFLESLNTKEK